MNKTLFLILLVIATTLLVGSVSAQNCKVTVQSKNTKDLLNEIPGINSQLQTCPGTMNSWASRIIGNGNTQINIAMNDGTTESLYATISNKQVTSIQKGTIKYKYLITTDESTVDSILASNNRFSAFLSMFQQKKIKVQAKPIFSKIKLVFAKPLLGLFGGKVATPQKVEGSGKPEYCDETYIAGHSGYAENKEKWDQYSAETDGACQSRYGRGIPSPCVYSVQLSISGNPYYLCWYNNP